MQKKEVNKQVCFRTKPATQRQLTKEIEEIAPALAALMAKWERNPHEKPSNTQEKKAMRVLKKLKLVAKDLKGSSGYKQCRRNEIRALIRKMSTPALFLTLNPADILDPLIAAFAGLDPAEWKAMSGHARQVFVAKHPAPAARYFDCMITSFINTILNYSPSGKESGLFGVCTAYYGMVEAQGRGTLHCHMLVWIAGNPSPQQLRDRMAENPEFKADMFTWLESIIKCELPGMTEPSVERHPDDAKAPKQPAGWENPQLLREPLLAELSEAEFEARFRQTVKDLAITCNWHDHRDTCWKHVRPGQAKNDTTCRMRIDGTTCALTTLDVETQSILLRRLHPRINNFNEFVLFLMRCNMDIKYIGSGEAAKALVFYVTDYITKSTLPAHVGLAAVEYAIKKNAEKFEQIAKAAKKDPMVFVPKAETVEKSLFTKTVMAIMSKQEISHQQVMSYLVGGGDHYHSHTFSNVRWGDFDRFVTKWDEKHGGQQPPTDNEGNNDDQGDDMVDEDDLSIDSPASGDQPFRDDPNDDGGDSDFGDDGAEEAEARAGIDEDEMLVRIDEEGLTVATDVADYIHRPLEDEFEQLCLWEHSEWVTKISKVSEAKRLAHAPENPAPTAEGLVKRKRGKKANVRGEYCAGHDHEKTHVARFRTIPVVPVLLGPKLPRPDRTDTEYEAWCRAMMILFCPWRNIEDLRGSHGSWKAAFAVALFNQAALAIMRNLNVENECQDARDEHDKLRRAGRTHGLLGGAEFAICGNDIDSLETALMNDGLLDDDDDSGDDPGDAGMALNKDELQEAGETRRENEMEVLLNNIGLWSAQNISDTPSATGATAMTDRDYDVVKLQAAVMAVLKKDKRPAPYDSDEAGPVPKRARTMLEESPPDTAMHMIQGATVQHRNVQHHDLSPEQCANILDTVITDLGIADNPEQERAVRMIGEHFILGIQDQLMLYIAGIGGSGKSHIIKAVVELFTRCGCGEKMLLSAPTGCAAILIDGLTIHALTFLPQKDYTNRSHHEELRRVWANVKYLVIDEVSMVSARFLSQISDRINQAKAGETAGLATVFGKVNVIFLGDFGQLPPVRASSVFAGGLVNRLEPNTLGTPTGVSSLFGAAIWRMVDNVIILRKNWRAQQDPEFTNLLNRVRVGRAWEGTTKHAPDQIGDGRNYKKSDFKVLQGRLIQTLSAEERESFADAPVIVSTKVARDFINRRLVKNFAAKTGRQVHNYCARDCFAKVDVQAAMRPRLWKVRSSLTKDAIGQLPLVPGMRVMITENVAIKAKVVNGQEGILEEVKYDLDENGFRYAKCAYVRIPGSGFKTHDLPMDVVPILPVTTNFKYATKESGIFSISRTQLPVLPAYAYTDYKAQGRSLHKVILDLATCWSLQSVYVMLSRATSLRSVAIFRQFEPKKIYKRITQEFREEFSRLEELATATQVRWEERRQNEVSATY